MTDQEAALTPEAAAALDALAPEPKQPASALASLPSADRAEIAGWSKERLAESFARAHLAAQQATVQAGVYREVTAWLLCHYARWVAGTDGKLRSVSVDLDVGRMQRDMPVRYAVPVEVRPGPDGKPHTVTVRVEAAGDEKGRVVV